LANFQILGPLGCQGWVVIPQNVKKSQNHCTLIDTLGGIRAKNVYERQNVMPGCQASRVGL
jgi:hypothetical protein